MPSTNGKGNMRTRGENREWGGGSLTVISLPNSAGEKAWESDHQGLEAPWPLCLFSKGVLSSIEDMSSIEDTF